MPKNNLAPPPPNFFVYAEQKIFGEGAETREVKNYKAAQKFCFFKWMFDWKLQNLVKICVADRRHRREKLRILAFLAKNQFLHSKKDIFSTISRGGGLPDHPDAHYVTDGKGVIHDLTALIPIAPLPDRPDNMYY